MDITRSVWAGAWVVQRETQRGILKKHNLLWIQNYLQLSFDITCSSDTREILPHVGVSAPASCICLLSLDTAMLAEVGTSVRSSSRAAMSVCGSARTTHITAVQCGWRPVTSHCDKRDLSVVWGAQLSPLPRDTCQLRAGHTEAGWVLPAVRQYQVSTDTGAMGYWGRLSDLLTTDNRKTQT